jgi:Domain of unknown function (DUF4105)
VNAQINRVLKSIGIGMLVFVLLIATGWGVLALLYWDHANLTLRHILALAYGIAALLLIVGFVLPRWRWRALAAFAALFAILLVAWESLQPSNNRNWVPENAVLAYATFDGDLVTLHNVRNFDYRSETDFTPAYYDMTVDLRKFDAVDVFAVYWMGPAIAHIFVSYGFSDGKHVAISIEARKEQGEGYSSVQGFFRQYELYYVVADERDVVRLRTNYRHDPPEQVYMYRANGNPENGRRAFLDYLREINSLKDHAAWYNTLTSNCTSNIWLHARVNAGHVAYSWKILLSGYLPAYLYEHGKLDTAVPFEELTRRAQINALAHAADQDPNFSQRIRADEPIP